MTRSLRSPDGWSRRLADVADSGLGRLNWADSAPKLREVTWSKLSYTENNLYRGYKAGIIFKGSDFVPGVTFTHRRVGESGPPPGNKDYFWRLPNIYFGGRFLL
jgi:hypothetical protein